MLRTLIINNFTLIDNLEVNFDKGLNILTGETGAGKSILIDAIDLAFGARASKDQIKTGENKALIELYLDIAQNLPKSLLEENGIELEEDNTLIISREISQSGTRSRINGIMVTQNYIQELRSYLIDIHSQHETYNYIQPKTHINLLDSYGDVDHHSLVHCFGDIYAEYKETQKELEFAKSQIQTSEQKIDFLKFQIQEISEAKIEDPEEYDNLMQERLLLINAEDLKDLTLSGYNCLYGEDNSIIDVLSKIESKLEKASEFDKNLSQFAETISSSAITLKDVASELRDYSESMDTDREKLALIEERIDQLDKLKRKYGPSLAEVISNLEKFEAELSEIEVSSEKVDILTKKLAELDNKLQDSAQKLSGSRKSLAFVLSDLIQQELVKLEMPKVQFAVNVQDRNEVLAKGIDDVEFMISSNPGEPLRPLAKIASGGEISRVMLAIKTIFAKADSVNTVIFDEIDTGISGKTSQSVGEELADLSKTHQILCITHQPIIAAMADNYLYIEKIQTEVSTRIKVTSLNEEQRIHAISKLASGSSNDTDSLNFATKLITQARSYKENFQTV